jgi:hypothetical protein
VGVRAGWRSSSGSSSGSQTSANGSGRRHPRGLAALGCRRPESIRWALLTEMPAAARGHLLAAAGSSFGHVQRNLLSGEGSRHGPVPCPWQPDSAEPLQSGQPVWRDPSTRLSSDRRGFYRTSVPPPLRRLRTACMALDLKPYPHQAVHTAGQRYGRALWSPTDCVSIKALFAEWTFVIAYRTSEECTCWLLRCLGYKTRIGARWLTVASALSGASSHC